MRLPIWIIREEKLNNLTNCEMNMYLWLVERQNSMSLVRGVKVSDFKGLMSKQSFYNALIGLERKGLIQLEHDKNYHDYNVSLMFNKAVDIKLCLISIIIMI